MLQDDIFSGDVDIEGFGVLCVSWIFGKSFEDFRGPSWSACSLGGNVLACLIWISIFALQKY